MTEKKDRKTEIKKTVPPDIRLNTLSALRDWLSWWSVLVMAKLKSTRSLADSARAVADDANTRSLRNTRQLGERVTATDQRIEANARASQLNFNRLNELEGKQANFDEGVLASFEETNQQVAAAEQHIEANARASQLNFTRLIELEHRFAELKKDATAYRPILDTLEEHRKKTAELEEKIQHLDVRTSDHCEQFRDVYSRLGQSEAGESFSAKDAEQTARVVSALSGRLTDCEKQLVGLRDTIRDLSADPVAAAIHAELNSLDRFTDTLAQRVAKLEARKDETTLAQQRADEADRVKRTVARDRDTWKARARGAEAKLDELRADIVAVQQIAYEQTQKGGVATELWDAIEKMGKGC